MIVTLGPPPPKSVPSKPLYPHSDLIKQPIWPDSPVLLFKTTSLAHSLSQVKIRAHLHNDQIPLKPGSSLPFHLSPDKPTRIFPPPEIKSPHPELLILQTILWISTEAHGNNLSKDRASDRPYLEYKFFP